ncbi:MAG: pyridoxine 5'-phosphate synthase, partial [Terracidiphilus sp.]
GKAEAEWQRIVGAVKLARAAGLEVHAGHGLDYATAETIATLPEIAELNVRLGSGPIKDEGFPRV